MYREIKFDLVERTINVVTGEVGATRVPVGSIRTFYKQGQVPLLKVAELTEGGVARKWVTIDWENAFLFQAIGGFDKIGRPVFHGDILQDETGKCFEVFAGYGSFFILDEQENPLMLFDNVLRKLTRVGDIIQDSDLITKPVDEKEFVENINNKK